MEKIKPGIYTARPDSELSPSELEKRTQLIGQIKAKAEEMIREYDEERRKAEESFPSWYWFIPVISVKKSA